MAQRIPTLNCATVLLAVAACALLLASRDVDAQPHSTVYPNASLADFHIQAEADGRATIALLPPVVQSEFGAADIPPRLASAPPHLAYQTDFHAPPVAEVLPPPSRAMYNAPDAAFGPSLRLFEPKARVYFDTGWEAADKLDIFHDGSLAPSINFLEIFWARPWDERLGRADWRWGPNIGVGISSRAGDSSDGTVQASGAPVLLMSYGFLLEFPLTPSAGYSVDPGSGRWAPKAGIEFGYALGVSSDESLDYSADGAIYVGVSLHAAP